MDSPWYRDGGDYRDRYGTRPRALRALEMIDRNNPQLAALMAQWVWIFDEDMLPDEANMVENIAVIDREFPELLPHIVELPWIQDGVNHWEPDVLGDLIQLISFDARDFALELAIAPWVVDGVSVLEEIGTSNLTSMALNKISPHTGSALAHRVLSFINYPPTEVDFYLTSSLQIIHWRNPDEFGRLLTEPWFVDGLDEQERIYLIAAGGSDMNADQLFEPYHIASASIVLPHSGVVNLWIVQRQPFHPGHVVLANLEDAVRASEQFWELPFPVDHVILSLLVGPDSRGAHLGRMMVLPNYAGEVRPTLFHEVAHYYFNSGIEWFTEGGAEYVRLYATSGGNIPTVEFPSFCREHGVHNLHAWNELGHGEVWDRCRYSMGLHFMVALRETMGDEAWRSALRAFYLSVGYQGLYFLGWNGAPRDEEIYHVFLEHTPPHLVEAVKDVYRRLHGGPFVD